MASIERTVYPRLKKTFTDAELKNYYTPTEDEIYFTNSVKKDYRNCNLLTVPKPNDY